MNMMIRSKIVKIGNSRGIRIPKSVLEQAGLTDEIEMKVEGDKLIISSSQYPRQNWPAKFLTMSEQGDDRLLDEDTSTQWDKEEWTW